MAGQEPPAVDTAMLGFYAAGGEASRLGSGFFQLEQRRTEDLLVRHLSPPPARVLDVGGGPGAYACWAAARGYEVTLIDPIPLHVEQARGLCHDHPDRAIAAIELGDARQLPFPDASQDGVLMLGPLYHLQERTDRLRALREANRVLRPGGVLCAAGISRFASLLASLFERLDADPAFEAIVDRDLKDGCHLNPSGPPEWFTTAYFHRPEELADELKEAGLEAVEVLGIEGPGWMLSDFDTRWSDPGGQARLLARMRAVESEPSLLGASAHLMAVGRRP